MFVQTEALERAIKLLAAAGCKYAIVTADGTKLGTLELATAAPAKPRRQMRFPVGTLKAYYAPYVAKVGPGDAVMIPYGEFSDQASKDALRAALCGYCSKAWGNKSYISHMNSQGIELLRIE